MEPLNAWWSQMARICQDFLGAVQQIGWIVLASWCLILAGGFKCFYLPHAEMMFLLWHFRVLYYTIFIYIYTILFLLWYYIYTILSLNFTFHTCHSRWGCCTCSDPWSLVPTTTWVRGREDGWSRPCSSVNTCRRRQRCQIGTAVGTAKLYIAI